MTGHLDRYGEPIEDDDNHEVLTERGGSWGVAAPAVNGGSTRTRDEIHRERCAQLRAILAEARERREAKP